MPSTTSGNINKGNVLPGMEIVLNLLESLLPDSSYAIYQSQAQELVLQSSREKKWRFAERIAGKTAAAMQTADQTEWIPELTTLTPTVSKLLAASPGKAGAGQILIRPLVDNHTLLGLLAIHNTAGVESILSFPGAEGIGGLLENWLKREHELKELHNYQALMSNLVEQTTQLDITSPAIDWCRSIVSAISGILPYDQLSISLYDSHSTEYLKIAFTTGIDKSFGVGHEFELPNVWHGEICLQNKPLTGNLADSCMGRIDQGDLQGTKLRSIMGVPIVESGTARGSLVLESKQLNCYTLDDVAVLESIAQLHGTALIWAARYQEEHAIATIDGLTELFNHRSFMERLNEELERNTRYGEGLTFLMLDLDHFKAVNDTYGHLHGDHVLSETAQLIKSSIRLADTAGRIGGEEFGVIIINATKQQSRSTAERIKNSIADHLFKSDGAECRLTVSIGMSEYPTDGRNLREIIQRADQAMYYVKGRGGNSVASYSHRIERQ